MNKVFDIQTTNKFKKQYAKIKKQDNFKKEEFEQVLKLLSNNELLPKKYHNHLLEPKKNLNMGMSHPTRYITRIQEKRQYPNTNFSCYWLSFRIV